MKSITIAVAFALAYALSQPSTVLANGPAGHGGGHSGGGHFGGSHSGGGHSGGHSSGGHAGSSHAGSTEHSAAASRSGGSVSSSGTARAGARPRDGHPIVGTAVPRTTIAPVVVTSFGVLPSSRWPYSSSAFGIGGLSFYQDPRSSDYYSYGGYPPNAHDPFDAAGPTGGLRLKVEPKDAEGYVDGYFAGIVDDFNGHFQQLKLTAGPHRVEVRAPGYLPLVFDVSIQPRHTTEYRDALQRNP